MPASQELPDQLPLESVKEVALCSSEGKLARLLHPGLRNKSAACVSKVQE
jgi:hypothetical protein